MIVKWFEVALLFAGVFAVSFSIGFGMGVESAPVQTIRETIYEHEIIGDIPEVDLGIIDITGDVPASFEVTD